jgi:hypothetical protein
MSDDPGGGGGDAGGADFLGSLPAEIRGEGALKNFGGPDGGAKLANSFLSLNKSFSGRSMADMDAPGDDAGRRAVLSKLGHAAPDSPDGYTLPDKASAPAFRALAHKHGLSTKQAEAMFGDMDSSDVRLSDERKTRMDSRKAETEKELRTEWGNEFDSNTELIKRGAEHFFSDEMRSMLEATGIDQNPQMRKLLYSVGRQMKEGTLHAGTGPAQGGAETLQTMKTEVHKFMEENKILVLSQDDTKPGVMEAKAKLREMNNKLAAMEVNARNTTATAG